MPVAIVYPPVCWQLNSIQDSLWLFRFFFHRGGWRGHAFPPGARSRRDRSACLRQDRKGCGEVLQGRNSTSSSALRAFVIRCVPPLQNLMQHAFQPAALECTACPRMPLASRNNLPRQSAETKQPLELNGIPLCILWLNLFRIPHIMGHAEYTHEECRRLASSQNPPPINSREKTTTSEKLCIRFSLARIFYIA